MFVADVFASVPRTDQRAKGEYYLRGLMLEGRRKSIQPMAGRLPDGNMQALQQFVNQSPWDPLPVRQRIAERLSQAVRPEVWVIDDVSFPKCGTASVGVARQYCGAVGKRANCQVAVSVHAATDTASCPLEWQLYLPREWTDEPERCRRAGVPEDVVHREKWRLALGLLDTLAKWQVEAPVVVADLRLRRQHTVPARSPGARAALRPGPEREGSRSSGGCPAAPARLWRARAAHPSPLPHPAASPLHPRGGGGCGAILRSDLEAGQQGRDDLTIHGADGAARGQTVSGRSSGGGRGPQPVGRRPAHPNPPGRMAGRPGHPDGLLDIEPAV